MSDQLSGTYFVVPVEVLADETLTDGTVRVLAVIYGYRTRHGGDRIFPGRERLARESGTNIRSVDRALAQAKKHGWITWRRLGFGKQNIYTILRDAGTPRPMAQEEEPKQATPDSPEQATMEPIRAGTGESFAPHPARYYYESTNKGEGEERTVAEDGNAPTSWPYPLTSRDKRPSLMRLTDEIRGEGYAFVHDDFSRDVKAGKKLTAVLVATKATIGEYEAMVRYHKTVAWKGGGGYPQTWVAFCSYAEAILGEIRRGPGVSQKRIDDDRRLAAMIEKKDREDANGEA